MVPPNIGTYWGNSYWNQTPQAGWSSGVSNTSGVSGSIDYSNTPLLPGGAGSYSTIPQRDNSAMLRTLTFILQMKEMDKKPERDDSDDSDKPKIKNYDAELGKRLVKASKVAVDKCQDEFGAKNKGKCGRGVKYALEEAFGEKFEGADGADWAKVLSKRDDFKKKRINGSDVKDYPAGTIVVWDRTDDSPNGHVAILDGKGHERSNKKFEAIESLRGAQKCTVFIPVDQDA